MSQLHITLQHECGQIAPASRSRPDPGKLSALSLTPAEVRGHRMESPQGNYRQPSIQDPEIDAAEQPRVAHSGIHTDDPRITLPLVELLGIVDQELWPGVNDRDKWVDGTSADFEFDSNVDKLSRVIAFRSGEPHRAFLKKYLLSQPVYAWANQWHGGRWQS